MQTRPSKGLVVLSLVGLLGLPGLRVGSQVLANVIPGSTIAQAESPTEPVPASACDVDPGSPACSAQQMLDQLLQEREDRENQAVNQMVTEFPEDFGYDPRNYQLKLHLAGDNFTVVSKSDWVTFRVMPETGVIEVDHAAATRDAFWGTLVWHDHEMVSTTFSLDEDACQVVSDGVNCDFTGVDTIQINQNFLTNHQLIKHGKWHLTYIESGQEKDVMFRVPEDALPEGAESTNIEELNTRLCRLFPNGLDCQ